MAIEPEEPRKKISDFVPGQDISTLSEHELSARIEVYEQEIVRLREAIKVRQSTKSAADAFFKR